MKKIALLILAFALVFSAPPQFEAQASVPEGNPPDSPCVKTQFAKAFIQRFPWGEFLYYYVPVVRPLFCEQGQPQITPTPVPPPTCKPKPTHKPKPTQKPKPTSKPKPTPHR